MGIKKINWASVFCWIIYPGLVYATIAVVIWLLMSCRTVDNHESYAERHRLESVLNRMDSIWQQSQTVQQDTSWHETFIKELQSIKERNDTNRTVVVDSTGKVIKETVTIIREREVNSEKDRLEREGMMHRLEKMDSVLAVNTLQTQRIDSLIQEKNKTTVIKEEQPWYRKMWNGLKTLLVGIVIGAVLLGIGLALTKKWWRNLIKL